VTPEQLYNVFGLGVGNVLGTYNAATHGTPITMTSCAIEGAWSTKVPNGGLEMRVSTAKLDDKTIWIDDHHVCRQTSWDMGAGNWLNIRYIEKVEMSPENLATSFEKAEMEIPAAIKDGPPVWVCYFGSIHGNMIYGWPNYAESTYASWTTALQRDVNTTKAVMEKAKEVLTKCNLIFLINGPEKYNQLDKFNEMLRYTGWAITNQVQLHNRKYPTYGNYLNLFHLQLA